MGGAVFVVESPHWTRYSLRILRGTDQKGACLREMRQGSCEISLLATQKAGVRGKGVCLVSALAGTQDGSFPPRSDCRRGGTKRI